jgi:hypothetical protein
VIWLPVTVLLVSLPSFIVWTFREIRRLERQHASLAKSVADVEDEVIGLLHLPKGTT